MIYFIYLKITLFQINVRINFVDIDLRKVKIFDTNFIVIMRRVIPIDRIKQYFL